MPSELLPTTTNYINMTTQNSKIMLLKLLTCKITQRAVGILNLILFLRILNNFCQYNFH